MEVKFRVHDPAALVAALKAHGIELGLPAEQDDQAYAPEGWSDGDDRRGAHAHGPDPQGPAVRLVRRADGVPRRTDGVGVFVEVERQVPDGVPGEAVQAELSRFVEALGIRVERCLDTYDSLVRASVVYEDAWESWNASDYVAAWDATTADGLGS